MPEPFLLADTRSNSRARLDSHGLYTNGRAKDDLPLPRIRNTGHKRGGVEHGNQIMGWRGTLRSLNAAANRSIRERERRERAAARSQAKVHHSYERVLQRARQLEEKLQRDPIAALKLQFDAARGFVSEPFALDEPPFSGSLSLTSGSETRAFTPDSFRAGTSVIEPVALTLTTVGTFVVLRASHNSPEQRLRLNWVKRPERSESRLVLVDREHGEHYFPLSTQLTGEVIPGVPREGIVAFETLRQAATTLELHFRDVKIEGNEKTFSFATAVNALQVNSSPQPLRDVVRGELDRLLAPPPTETPATGFSFGRVLKGVFTTIFVVVALCVVLTLCAGPPGSPTTPAEAVDVRAPAASDAHPHGEAPPEKTHHPKAKKGHPHQ